MAVGDARFRARFALWVKSIRRVVESAPGLDQLAPAVELDGLSGILRLERIRVIVYPVHDANAATVWWAHMLGTSPYLVGEGFAAFHLGRVDLVLGARLHLPDGGLACWEVDDLPAALELALARGATALVPLTDIGTRFEIAGVTSPDGAALGFARRRASAQDRR